MTPRFVYAKERELAIDILMKELDEIYVYNECITYSHLKYGVLDYGVDIF